MPCVRRPTRQFSKVFRNCDKCSTKMADIVSTEKRSRMMAGIRRMDTSPELVVRRAVFAEGLRFRLHRKDLPGAPDIVLPRHKVAVFVHGCFWHRHRDCRLAKLPASNALFWLDKLNSNVERDQRVIQALLAAGWRVLTVWECATRDATIVSKLGRTIRTWIAGRRPFAEIANPRASDPLSPRLR